MEKSCAINYMVVSYVPITLQHQINTSNMVVNSANSAKFSKDNFGVRHIFKNGSTVARNLPFSHQNGENVAYNGTDNGSDDNTNVGTPKLSLENFALFALFTTMFDVFIWC